MAPDDWQFQVPDLVRRRPWLAAPREQNTGPLIFPEIEPVGFLSFPFQLTDILRRPVGAMFGYTMTEPIVPSGGFDARFEDTLLVYSLPIPDDGSIVNNRLAE